MKEIKCGKHSVTILMLEVKDIVRKINERITIDNDFRDEHVKLVGLIERLKSYGLIVIEEYSSSNMLTITIKGAYQIPSWHL